MLKKICLIGLALCFPLLLSAQLTYGTTGLLNAPSAEMQRDKTVMIGGNFLNKEITPPHWYYHTYNYFLNVTIFPWLEVAYTCTLVTAESLGLTQHGYSGFTNQDRYFSFRLRLLKEGQFWSGNTCRRWWWELRILTQSQGEVRFPPRAKAMDFFAAFMWQPPSTFPLGVRRQVFTSLGCTIRGMNTA